MCPHRPVQPLEVKVEGLLVVWFSIGRLMPLPLILELDVAVVCHALSMGYRR